MFQFQPPDELVRLVGSVELAAGDLRIPLSKVAALFAEEMRNNVRAGGRAPAKPWPPHQAATVARWGEHPLGVNTGAALGDIGPFVRDTFAGAAADTKSAIFMHRARSRSWRLKSRGGNPEDPSYERNLRESLRKGKASRYWGEERTERFIRKARRRDAMAQRATERKEAGGDYSGFENPLREFGIVSEAAGDAALELIVDFLFEKVI